MLQTFPKFFEGAPFNPVRTLFLRRTDESALDFGAFLSHCSKEYKVRIYQSRFSSSYDTPFDSFGKCIYSAALSTSPRVFHAVVRAAPQEASLERIGFKLLDYKSYAKRLVLTVEMANLSDNVLKVVDAHPEYKDYFINLLYNFLLGIVNDGLKEHGKVLFMTLLKLGSEEKILDLMNKFTSLERSRLLSPWDRKELDRRKILMPQDMVLLLTDTDRWAKLSAIFSHFPLLRYTDTKILCADGLNNSWLYEDLYSFRKDGNWLIDADFSAFPIVVLDQLIKMVLDVEREEGTVLSLLCQVFDKWAKTSDNWDAQLKIEGLGRKSVITPRLILSVLKKGITFEELFAKPRSIAFDGDEEEGTAAVTFSLSGAEQKLLKEAGEFFGKLWEGEFSEKEEDVITTMPGLSSNHFQIILRSLSDPLFSFKNLEEALASLWIGQVPSLQKKAIKFVSDKFALCETIAAWEVLLNSLINSGVTETNIWDDIVSEVHLLSYHHAIPAFLVAEKLKLISLKEKILKKLQERAEEIKNGHPCPSHPESAKGFLAAVEKAGLDRLPEYKTWVQILEGNL